MDLLLRLDDLTTHLISPSTLSFDEVMEVVTLSVGHKRLRFKRNRWLPACTALPTPIAGRQMTTGLTECLEVDLPDFPWKDFRDDLWFAQPQANPLPVGQVQAGIDTPRIARLAFVQH